MKSARLDAFTDRIDDIRIEGVPEPEPGPGQVRDRMLMSPVSPADPHFVRGTYHDALERMIWNHDGAAAQAALGEHAVIETDTQDLVGEVAQITDGRGVACALDCVGGELAGEGVAASAWTRGGWSTAPWTTPRYRSPRATA